MFEWLNWIYILEQNLTQKGFLPKFRPKMDRFKLKIFEKVGLRPFVRDYIVIPSFLSTWQKPSLKWSFLKQIIGNLDYLRLFLDQISKYLFKWDQFMSDTEIIC